MVQFLGQDIFDHILMNKQKPSPEAIELYAAEGELVESDSEDPRIIFANLLGKPKQNSKGDILKRSLIRHDSKKLAHELVKIVDSL